jgi:Fe-S cluster assembly iron-binding protein IscA
VVSITEIAADKVKEVLVQKNMLSGYLRLYVAGYG